MSSELNSKKMQNLEHFRPTGLYVVDPVCSPCCFGDMATWTVSQVFPSCNLLLIYIILFH